MASAIFLHCSNVKSEINNTLSKINTNLNTLRENVADRAKSPISNGLIFSNYSLNYPYLNISHARKVMQSMGYGVGLTTDEEWNPFEKDIIEEKYYAPVIGVVLEVMVQGGSERSELISISTE